MTNKAKAAEENKDELAPGQPTVDRDPVEPALLAKQDQYEAPAVSGYRPGDPPAGQALHPPITVATPDPDGTNADRTAAAKQDMKEQDDR